MRLCAIFARMTFTVSGSLALFSIMAIGLALSKVKIKGISLDISAVVFVALAFGAFGVRLDAIFQTIGLVLFVYSVGIQSGPSFVGSFKTQGAKLLLPVAGIVVLSAGATVAVTALFSFDPLLSLGLLTGARSSNSALAVSVESTASKLPSLGHSLSYPIGVLGALLTVRLLPIVFRADLAREEAAYKQRLSQRHPPLETKTFVVENPNLIGKSLSSLHFSKLTGANLSRVMVGGIILLPSPNVVLQKGDLVKAVGTRAELENVRLFVGSEIVTRDFDEVDLDLKHEAQWITVTNRKLIHKSLAEIALLENFQANVTRIKRNEIEIVPHSSSTLRFGDRLMVVCRKASMEEVRSFLGDPKRPLEADFLPMTLAIVIGILLGSVGVPIGGHFVFHLGTTGGVLVAALALGNLGKTGPVTWQISESSTRFVRQLGLLFFLSAVGCDAGAHLGAALSANGLSVLWASLAISLIPLFVCALVCRFVFKMDVLTLMGLISGGTTCSPALAIATSVATTNVAATNVATKGSAESPASNAPSVAYAAAYPASMILMMICAQALAWAISAGAFF